MKRIEAAFKIIDKLFYWLTAINIAVMTLLIFIQVLLRYLFSSPLAWSEELARYLFIWMTFLAGYIGLRKGKHIGVEALQNALPAIPGKILKVFSFLLSGTFFGAIVYYVLVSWQKLTIQTSPATGIPITIVYLGMVAGALFMCLWYLVLAVKVFTDRYETAAVKEVEVE